MAVYDTYHRRKSSADAETASDVLRYDLPTTLRTQLRRTFVSAIGPWVYYTGYSVVEPNNVKAWERLADLLRQEFGRDNLVGFLERNPCTEVCQFIDEASTDEALTAVEFCCRYIDDVMRGYTSYQLSSVGAKEKADEALAEVNVRFQQAGAGYRFERFRIVRIDSEFAHADIVKPAFKFLADPRFKGAEDEFLKAHRKHREGDDKAAVTEANNAFESTMKAICAIHKWEYPVGARPSDLVRVIEQNGLFPDYLGKSFEHLQALLKSGLPTVRHNAGSHGQGPTVKTTPSFVGAYALHLAAANIIYICEASKALEACAKG